MKELKELKLPSRSLRSWDHRRVYRIAGWKNITTGESDEVTGKLEGPGARLDNLQLSLETSRASGITYRSLTLSGFLHWLNLRLQTNPDGTGGELAWSRERLHVVLGNCAMQLEAREKGVI